MSTHDDCMHLHGNISNIIYLKNEPPHDKTNKMTVHPGETQISLDIRPVWSVLASAQWEA